MRFLFVPLSWPSHYLPLVPLAWACRSAGHDVRVAGQPAVLGAVHESGLTGVDLGPGFDFQDGIAQFRDFAVREFGRVPTTDQIRALAPEDARRFKAGSFDMHLKVAAAMADGLVSLARAWRPEVVVADPLVFAAPLAAAAAGAPLVRHLWGPDVSRQFGHPGSGVRPGTDVRASWPAGLTELFQRHGVEPAADFADGIVDPCPDAMQLPDLPNRIPVRHVPYNGPGPVPAWLLEPPARPRVCVTWSAATTLFMGPESFLVPRILEALEALDIEVFVALGDEDRRLLGTPPAGVRVVQVPLNLLLPTCAAIVHTASAGTLLTALVAGVPQVVIAQGVADQTLNAVQLARAGAGVSLSPQEADVPAIRAAVVEALTGQGTRAGARKLRDEMLSRPAPAEIVPTLAGLA
ncbi:nucleotide disphospho-sugar-binding domain-containing protein [Actinoplanes sp. NPDC004185]